jgi:thiol-disulfide isomerase/thioredoxin
MKHTLGLHPVLRRCCGTLCMLAAGALYADEPTLKPGEPVPPLQIGEQVQTAVALQDDADLKKELQSTIDSHGKVKGLVDKPPGNTKSALPTDPVGGVGLVFDKVGQDFVINKIFADSPAAAENEIIVGDRILAVTEGNKPAVALKNLDNDGLKAVIRGKVGSIVRLTIAHPGEADARARTVSLTREDISNLVRAKGVKPVKVGDVAPTLSCGTWVQGKPVGELEKDKAYLVEFWATTCGPCVALIPHLNEIANKFKDKGLVVIGQDIWEDDASKVKRFVEKMGDKITYRVAMDDGKSTMAESWMKAAGEIGIPCAFLVGKDGKIAWIGHPGVSSLDGIIESVVNKARITTSAPTAEAALKSK